VSWIHSHRTLSRERGTQLVEAGKANEKAGRLLAGRDRQHTGHPLVMAHSRIELPSSKTLRSAALFLGAAFSLSWTAWYKGIMKSGTVLIAEHSEPREDLVDRIRARDGDDSWVTPGDMSCFTGRFYAHWEPDEGDDLSDFRQGPEHVSAEEAIAWGRSQADIVLIRVGIGEFGGDESGYFSAGVRHPEDVPVWPEGGLDIRPRPEPRLLTGVPLDDSDARQALDKVVIKLRQLPYSQLRKRIVGEYPWVMRDTLLARLVRRVSQSFGGERLAIVSGSHKSETASTGPSGTRYRVRVQIAWVRPSDDIRVVAWIDDHDYDPPEERIEQTFVVVKPEAG
jgi:hypothetical protein